jgi:hypothetical protein
MKLHRLAALALLPLALVACADAATGPVSVEIPHGTAPTDVLVRVALEGGFVPLEWTFTNVPVFSLYGDGTLVVPGAQIEIYPAPALPALSRRHVDEAGVQAILVEALDAIGGVPDDLSDLGTTAIADAPSTAITVSAGRVDRTIRVYALAELNGRPDGMPDDEYRARRGLQELVARLGSLESWLPAGSLGAEDGYDASSARLFVGAHRKVDDLPQEAVAWPLDGSLARFGEPTDLSKTYRCGVLDGTDWTTVRTVATRANELSPWTDGNAEYSILFRPLLPDETGC